MRRALTIANIYNTKRVLMPFEGKWEAAMGSPEMSGAWLIWGDSGSGKTTFVAQLCKYLTKFGRVAYNSLEEGNSETIKKALKRVKMEDVAHRIVLLDKEPIAELKERLAAHKSPQIIVIDSVQYAELTYKLYKELKDAFRNKLFILISHSDGRLPSGKVAKSMRYDVNVKIRTEGYRAFVVSRYGGSEPITIWEEGAAEYWGTDAPEIFKPVSTGSTNKPTK